MEDRDKGVRIAMVTGESFSTSVYPLSPASSAATGRTGLSRRSLLAVGAGTAVGLALPSVSAQAADGKSAGARFLLNAQTLDGGEQIVSLTLQTAQLGPISPGSLTPGTFKVHVKATSPIPIAASDKATAEYDLDRKVTAVKLDGHGNIVIGLSYAEGQTGGGTLGYIISKGRNVRLNLVYTVKQTTPIALRHGGSVTFTRFTQGRLSNPEVDAFSYHAAGSGLKYRLYSPENASGKRPLIVWLHGGGEGGQLSDGYYDNETTLRANRGALGFATPEAQRIFQGAYVVAPQCTSAWMDDGPRFAPLISDVIKAVARQHHVDPNRVYVTGCSNGGYMSLKMTTVYPGQFAASVPICGVVEPHETGEAPMIPDAELKKIATPTWLVASRDDDTVNPTANSVHAHALIPKSLITLYNHVIWKGHQFPGHWSWIYVARNNPSSHGTHIWQWMARQRRKA